MITLEFAQSLAKYHFGKYLLEPVMVPLGNILDRAGLEDNYENTDVFYVGFVHGDYTGGGLEYIRAFDMEYITEGTYPGVYYDSYSYRPDFVWTPINNTVTSLPIPVLMMYPIAVVGIFIGYRIEKIT